MEKPVHRLGEDPRKIVTVDIIDLAGANFLDERIMNLAIECMGSTK